MKASVDKEGCISCGMCIEICPEIFRMGEDDVAEVYKEVNEEHMEAAQEARDECPVAVISIED